MANLRAKVKWIVPPPLGVAVGWATGATADAPPPVAWTIAGIGDWLSVPFHWAFLVIGAVSGIGAFIGLQQFIHPSEPAPAPLPPEFGELTEEIKALRLQLLAQNPAGAEQIESFAATAIELAESDSAEDRSIAREAVEGDPLAASDRLMAEVETGVAEQAERARQAARIAAPFSVAKAITAYARAVELDPTDFWTWIELSRLHQAAGSLPQARRTAEAALQHVGDDRERMVAEGELGNITVVEGQLPTAARHYQAAMLASKALADADAGNVNLQRDLSVSHERLGDVAVAQGDLAGARTAYCASLVIAERLAASDPGNAGWQRDLSVSHNKLGDVAVAQGDLAGARAAYGDALAISERLASSDAGNAGWQRDLSVSHERLGDVARAEGDLAGARTAYGADLVIAERLAASDPGNAEWQRDLSVSHERLGDVAAAQGDLAGARTAYGASFVIAERLAASDPGNAGWQRDLSISHNKLGDVAEMQEDYAEAVRCYEASLPIARRLAETLPDHPGFANDLAITQRRIEQLRARLRGA